MEGKNAHLILGKRGGGDTQKFEESSLPGKKRVETIPDRNKGRLEIWKAMGARKRKKNPKKASVGSTIHPS